jgi:hypothetical protein
MMSRAPAGASLFRPGADCRLGRQWRSVAGARELAVVQPEVTS